MPDMLNSIRVYRVIRHSYLPNAVQAKKIQEHRHDYYQMIYAINDVGTVMIDGKSIPMQKNDVIVIRRDEMHSFFVKNGIFETYEIKFVFLNEDNDFLKSSKRYLCNDIDGEILAAFKQIEREAKHEDVCSREMIRIEIYKILTLMQRKRRISPPDSQNCFTESDEAHEDELLSEIKSYIDANIGSEITVRGISTAICVEYKYLSHYFAIKYGMRLKQYIRRRRLALAKDMLVYTDKSITGIAQQCGFGSIHYFISAFNQEEGMPPGEFRRRFKNMYSVSFAAEPKTVFDSTRPVDEE